MLVVLQEDCTFDLNDEKVTPLILADAALPVDDFSILSELLTKNHLVVTDRKTFIKAQSRDTKLQLLRSWGQSAKTLTADKIVEES